MSDLKLSKKRKYNPDDKIADIKNKAKSSDLLLKGAIDVPFFALTVALLTIGLVMLFSASYPYALQYKGDSYFFFEKQLKFAIAGFIIMLIVSKFNYRWLLALEKPLLIITLLLLVYVLIKPAPMQEGKEDFKRWIQFGPIRFQPSDIAKFSLILTMSAYVAKNYKKMHKITEGIVIPVVIIALMCGLIVLEHHLSCTILVFLIGAVIMFCGGSNWKIFAVGVGIVAAAAIFVVLKPDVLLQYNAERIQAWLDKSYEPLGARWQTNNSLYAIGSGGLFGAGLGNSKQKYLYVSEPQNDFIFSIVCEELGFIGAVAILALFIALFIRGVKIAMRSNDKFASLLVIGIISQVAIQTGFNILVVTDVFPNTGIALPFFSSGGTAMLMLMFEMGVVLSISRKVNQKKV